MTRIESKLDFKNSVINSQNLSMVKFTASWCGPCKIMIPILEKASENFKNINFFEIDVDDCDGLAEAYSISSVPTMIIFKNGKELNRISGAIPYDELETFLKSNS